MDEKETNILGKDGHYWWFEAKNSLIEREIGNLSLKILNIGPGVFPYWFAKNFYGNAKKLPYKNNEFDVIIMADVLEHIDKIDKWETINEFYRVLNKGGRVIVTVPAHQWLYNAHDRYLGHKLRYNKKLLLNEFRDFKVKKIRYWNSFLFLPLIFWKLNNRNGKQSDFKKIHPLLNKFLYNLLNLEKYLWFPFGTTIFAVFEKC